MNFYNYNNDTRRKVFISYHHTNDEDYKKEFERLFGHLFINKSVQDGSINSDNSTEYIKKLIQGSDYLRDASVCIVLVGTETYKRKHVDWEISGALDKKLSGYSGLLGICLPNHKNYNSKKYTESIVPQRLVNNLKSGYAKFYDWTKNEELIKKWIEEAFDARTSKNNLIDNSLPQFTYNEA